MRTPNLEAVWVFIRTLERRLNALTSVAGGSGSAITGLTGDVTATGPGSAAATIANDAVTYAKMQNASPNVVLTRAANSSGDVGETALSASQLLGRGSTGDVAAVALGAGLSMSGATLNVTGVGGGTTGSIGGRLTLVSATPVMISDQTAKTTIYYAEYTGNLVPIYDGSGMVHYSFSNISTVLDTTNHKSANLYDVFAYLSSGSAALGVGPAWTTAATITVTIATPAVVTWTGHGLPEGSPVVFTTTGALPTGITAGTTYYVGKSPAANTFNISTTVANAAAGTFVATSGSQSGTHTGTNHTTVRGTGAGTTEIERTSGLWTNKNTITLYNNSVSASVSANQATYLGTIYCTADGQTGMAFSPSAASGGTNNILGVFNAYNRVLVTAFSRDSAASWTYNSTTWQSSHASVSNRISFVDGLQENPVQGNFQILMAPPSAGSGYAGISLDSTTGAPQVTAQYNFATSAPAYWASVSDRWAPQLGFHYFQAMEASTNTTTFFGAASTPTRQLNALLITMPM